MVQCLRLLNFFIVSAFLLSHKTNGYVYNRITREQPSVPTEIQDEKEEESQIKEAQPTYLLVQINEEKKDTNARSGIGILMPMDDRGSSGYYDREHVGGYRFRRRRGRGRDLTKTHKNDDGFLIPRTKKTKPRQPNRYKQDTETIKQKIAGGKKGTLTGCFRRCILYRDRDCSCNPKYEG